MTQKIEHPLEALFNMEPGALDISTEYAVANEQKTTQVVPTVSEDEKDDEDKQIEKKIDDVYDAAMDTFKAQTGYAEIIEPRYAARNAEVAANFLNIALNAASTRAKVKADRKRANQFIPFGQNGKTTNNVIIADRNEILRMIDVDGEKKEIK